MGNQQLSIHITRILDYLKFFKDYCPRNLFSGSNSSPENSLQKNRSIFCLENQSCDRRNSDLYRSFIISHLNTSSSRVSLNFSKISEYSGQMGLSSGCEQRKVTRAERKKEARAVSSLRAPPVDACRAQTAATRRSGRCANFVCIDIRLRLLTFLDFTESVFCRLEHKNNSFPNRRRLRDVDCGRVEVLGRHTRRRLHVTPQHCITIVELSKSFPKASYHTRRKLDQ